MKLFRVSTLVAVSAAVVSGTLLFGASQTVQQAESKLSRLEKDTAREQEFIRVLQAEWGYLNQPARLEILAQDYLDLESPVAGRIMADDETLPKSFIPALPQHKPMMESQSVALKRAVKEMPVKIQPQAERTRSFQTLLSDLDGEGGRP